MDAAVADLFRMFERGEIKPEIMATYPLDDIHKAMDLIVARKVKGKIVLTTGRAHLTTGVARSLHQVDHQRIVALAALEVAEPLGGIGIIERFENILALILGAFLERPAPAFMEGFLDVGLQVGRSIGELAAQFLRRCRRTPRSCTSGCRSAIRPLRPP